MLKLNKLSPVLIVEEIEPSIDFWMTFGFNKTVEIPEGNSLGFLILEKDGIEIMYQSTASVKKDLPSMVKFGVSRASLYIECEDLTELLGKIDPKTIVVEPRKTFYGSKEVFVREPGGNVIGFAEKTV